MVHEEYNSDDESSYVYDTDDVSDDEDDEDTPIKMINASQLVPIMKAQIDEIADLFHVSPATAHALLRHFRWNKERLIESFMDNPEETALYAGVLARYNRDQSKLTHAPEKQQTKTCVICFEDNPRTELLKLPCNHEFCMDCWKGFTETMMKEDGPTCIHKNCPQTNCNELVTEEEIVKIIPELLPKFESFQLRSFVELSNTSCCCPGAGCERIATITDPSIMLSSSNFTTDRNATCDTCSTCFCLKCGQEPHALITCNDLVKWHEKCQNESTACNVLAKWYEDLPRWNKKQQAYESSKNTNANANENANANANEKWIIENTKKCPGCNKNIEKNKGCNHMTCTQCKHEFCWICKQDWKSHDAYDCNLRSQDTSNQHLAPPPPEIIWTEERFKNCYSKYLYHAQLQKLAKETKKNIEEKATPLLEEEKKIKVLMDSNHLLIECRRVLKYACIFTFYHIAHDHETDQALFQSRYENLERFTEGLSDLVKEQPADIDKIVNQTGAIKKYMKTLNYTE